MRQNRREFLRALGSGGGILLCRPSASAAAPFQPEEIEYQCRTVAVERLREARAVLDRLNRAGKLSRQKTIQGYLRDLEYEPAKKLPNARSLVLVATPWKLRSVGVRWNGKDHLVLIPGGYFYYEDMRFRKALMERLRRDVLRNSGAALVYANPPLKTLAVRSGLAAYGRNNIAYIDRYGSFHVLWAFLTDAVLPDQWARPYRMMRLCKGCSVCTRGCPTKAFTEPDFLVDAGRCISTYNELKGPIPGWAGAEAHNALIGCLKCQFACPANRELIRGFEHVADLTEAETALLLDGRRDSRIEASISEKLSGLGEWYARDMRYLARNLRPLLAAPPNFEVLR